jgi:peptidyl-prolyl cis-trans isomerase C
MTRFRLTALSLLAAVVLVAAACGGSDSDEAVPAGAIAVVDGEEVSKADFDAVMAQAEKGYESREQEFPKAGTPEHTTLKNQIVQFLVQREQFEQAADDMGVEVTDEDVDKRLQEIKTQYFEGDDKKYQEQIEKQGMTEEQVRRDVRAQVVQQKIFDQLTEDVEVTDAEIEAHYNENTRQYGQPESRDVRHILVPTKKLADQLHSQLQNGGNFEALAKKHSKDPGSAKQGGKLTVQRGQTVPPFDKAAFSLNVNQLSKPVKTQYGFHLIEPLSAVKPAKTTPLAEVKDQIRQQLLQERRNERVTQWLDETIKKEYGDKTRYQVGYQPPPTATAPTETDR